MQQSCAIETGPYIQLVFVVYNHYLLNLMTAGGGGLKET